MSVRASEEARHFGWYGGNLESEQLVTSLCFLFVAEVQRRRPAENKTQWEGETLISSRKRTFMTRIHSAIWIELR